MKLHTDGSITHCSMSVHSSFVDKFMYVQIIKISLSSTMAFYEQDVHNKLSHVTTLLVCQYDI